MGNNINVQCPMATCERCGAQAEAIAKQVLPGRRQSRDPEGFEVIDSSGAPWHVATASLPDGWIPGPSASTDARKGLCRDCASLWTEQSNHFMSQGRKRSNKPQQRVFLPPPAPEPPRAPPVAPHVAASLASARPNPIIARPPTVAPIPQPAHSPVVRVTDRRGRARQNPVPNIEPSHVVQNAPPSLAGVKVSPIPIPAAPPPQSRIISTPIMAAAAPTVQSNPLPPSQPGVQVSRIIPMEPPRPPPPMPIPQLVQRPLTQVSRVINAPQPTSAPMPIPTPPVARETVRTERVIYADKPASVVSSMPSIPQLAAPTSVEPIVEEEAKEQLLLPAVSEVADAS